MGLIRSLKFFPSLSTRLFPYTRITHIHTKMAAQYSTVRPEEEYPSLCVCTSSGKDHCNMWKNVFCPCFTSKKIATEAGLSNGMAWGCCLGIACCGPAGVIAHGAIVTQKLREKHGFQQNMVCGVL